MSNRKAHRRENSFRRSEKFVHHRLRRPQRGDRYERQLETRRVRRNLWKRIGEISEGTS